MLLKYIYITIILLIFSCTKSYAQFHTKSDLNIIHNSKSAHEGDMYVDTANGNHYIGVSTGELTHIGYIDSISFSNDTLQIHQGDSIFSTIMSTNEPWKNMDGTEASDTSTNINFLGNVGIGTSNPASDVKLEVAGKSQNQNVRSTVSSSSYTSRSSTSFGNVSGLSISVTTANAHLLILADIPGIRNSTADYTVNFRITVDGIQVGSIVEHESNSNGSIVWSSSLHALTSVTAGTHTIRVQWSVQGGTGYINSNQSVLKGPRTLSVIEL